MKTAYLDTSVLIAIVFDEPGSPRLRHILAAYDRVVSSDLLLAEALAVVARERLDEAVLGPVLESLSLVLPARSLLPECREALTHGYLRGADLWHIACALFFAASRRADLAFLSRDATQRTVAKALGFATP